MNNAVELFTAVPKLHNCAQAVAEGCGNKELAELMKTCGGGKAAAWGYSPKEETECASSRNPRNAGRKW
jgi:hypothetical protein